MDELTKEQQRVARALTAASYSAVAAGLPASLTLLCYEQGINEALDQADAMSHAQRVIGGGAYQAAA